MAPLATTYDQLFANAQTMGSLQSPVPERCVQVAERLWDDGLTPSLAYLGRPLGLI